MLATSTLNRVMIVELGLAALVPGALVGAHYGVQIARPLWGHGSDAGGRRTPWILGGVALLAAAVTGAALAVAVMADSFAIGLGLAIVDFILIGFGVGAAGTSLLALIASYTPDARRPATAMLVWLMMILGIAITGLATGRFLDPFSMDRLIAVTAAVALLATAVAVLALAGVEKGTLPAPPAGATRSFETFRAGLADAWHDPEARRFTVFVFVSMIAYSMQDLILEPYAGLVFGMTPGETTTLSGVQNGGVLAGMLLGGLGGTAFHRRFPAVLKHLGVTGCLLSAAALLALAGAASGSHAWPLRANVFALGFANGLFAVAAVASMMALAGAGGPTRTGLRMGLWGAAQGLGFGLGGFLGAAAVDAMRLAGAPGSAAYAGVFLIEAAGFTASAALAVRISMPHRVPEGGERRDAAAPRWNSRRAPA
ncbi:BCD family MFS transporter [Aureimonas leprariae]|uniref:BCD family MFS transporter n=2 Tax=Plantimonas leprariae TaxID=2615207 RepID=A0A7V7PQK6_9HYPH|nr:BCD family MFS transporter [Aureimonas leprariae]